MFQPKIERDEQSNAILCPKLNERGYCKILQKVVTGLLGNPKKQCNTGIYSGANLRSRACEVMVEEK